ncbi:hypothetical protein [Dietzia lutea]|nr:hypothetical protein [Dietzia lutea]
MGDITVSGVSDLVLEEGVIEASLGLATIDLVPAGVCPSAVTAFAPAQVGVLHSLPFVAQDLLGDGQVKMLVNLTQESELFGEACSAGFAATKVRIEEGLEVARGVCGADAELVELKASPEGRAR